MILKDIRTMVKNGTAKDVTYYTSAKYQELQKAENGLDTIAITYGKNLMNGALVKGRTTGQYYAILGRTVILWDAAN